MGSNVLSWKAVSSQTDGFLFAEFPLLSDTAALTKPFCQSLFIFHCHHSFLLVPLLNGVHPYSCTYLAHHELKSIEILSLSDTLTLAD